MDKIARIVCKEKQAEIDALKRQIEANGKEGRELCAKYCQMMNPKSKIDLFGDAHDLCDFLQAL